jgi:ornithine carbamoyltransferase
LYDFSHPCQVLGDLLTVQEKKRYLSGLKLTFIGDGNNVANSLLYGAAKVGMHITIVSPPGYEVKPEVLKEAREDAVLAGAELNITNDLAEGVQDADVVYTDVWASMGQESERRERIKIFKDYQVNLELLNKAKPDAIFMHCLPAHYDEEVTYEVAKDPRSVIYDEAENRMHAQKALMTLIV